LPGSGAVPLHSSRRSTLATTPRRASDPSLSLFSCDSSVWRLPSLYVYTRLHVATLT
jgi:hypothetical protein